MSLTMFKKYFNTFKTNFTKSKTNKFNYVYWDYSRKPFEPVGAISFFKK